jgi:hypothetical protein
VSLTRIDTLPGGPEAACGLPGYWYVVRPASLAGTEAGPMRSGSPSASGATVEQDGYVWEFRGPDGPLGGPPRLDILDRPRYVFEMRTIPIAADWRLVLENSLDFAHSSFLHAWSSPVWAIHHLRRSTVVEAEFGPIADGLAVDARVGPMRIFRHAFHLPDRMRLTLLPDTARPLDVLVHHVPDAPGRSRMEVLVGRPAWPWERPYREGAAIPFKPGALLLHKQDKQIVEAQHQAWLRSAPAQERSSAADAYTLLLRRVLEGVAELGANQPTRTIRFRF